MTCPLRSTPETDPLTKAQEDLLVEISGRKCAWRVGGGWRPKGSNRRIRLETADKLVIRGLAVEVAGKGTTRLELTHSGEAEALHIKKQRRAR
ncbi:conserved hypothetical protein [Roseibium sp. TrichSKD4]|uniref:hypothetical protein n=1 Tax=Roseibium sp. TrichSKD4 TaxID=744980 RepID=UPI0001E572CB|nr:hypothetical protein [Roseibium sp. TrichSKD4]EFO29115.1 conserved hypothetical protein [Roseibium sp. TrichSKD4]